MKHYYIIKDGEIVSESTSKRGALSDIRALQAQETHYWLKANFELLTKDDTDTTPDASPYPHCWHVLDGKRIVGAVCTREEAEARPESALIFGLLKSVPYPRSRSNKEATA